MNLSPFKAPFREAAFIGLAAILVSSVRAEDVPKRLQLLPARNLDSFYVYTRSNGLHQDPKKVFALADGILRVSGEQEGYLSTKAEYSRYRLIAEYRWAPGTNAGDSAVFVHGTGPDRWFMSSIECNLMAGSKYFSGEALLMDAKTRLTVNGVAKKGFAGFPQTDPTNHEKPRGEWNSLEILSDGARLEFKVNGHLVTAGTDAAPTGGKILLQSRRGEIFFRKLELEPRATLAVARGIVLRCDSEFTGNIHREFIHRQYRQ